MSPKPEVFLLKFTIMCLWHKSVTLFDTMSEEHILRDLHGYLICINEFRTTTLTLPVRKYRGLRNLEKN